MLVGVIGHKGYDELPEMLRMLHSAAPALGVRLRDNKRIVTDGPFAEGKEVVGGYAIVEAKSKEHAVAMTKRFLEVAGDGECEVRPMYQPEDFN